MAFDNDKCFLELDQMKTTLLKSKKLLGELQLQFKLKQHLRDIFMVKKSGLLFLKGDYNT